jgi:hypothetical protein
MDVPSTVEALVVAALVIAPGYVFTRTITRVISQVEEPPDLRFLMTTITWGLAIHALLLLSPWWPQQIPRTDQVLDFYLDKSLPAHAADIARWAVVSLAVVPWVLGQITARVIAIPWIDTKILDWLEFSIVDRTPTAWQYVLNKERSAYVLVFLKDGRVIGGCYTNKSFASNNPRHGDIYLETRCHLNDANEFQYGVLHSAGVWIAHDVISHVEFRRDVEFPTSGPDSTTCSEPTDRPETKSRFGGKGAPAKRFIATAAAFLQTIWRVINRLCKA